MSGSVDTAYNSTQETCIAKVLQLLIQSLLFEEVIFELRSELGEREGPCGQRVQLGQSFDLRQEGMKQCGWKAACKREGEGAAIGVMVGTDLLPCGGGTAWRF